MLIYIFNFIGRAVLVRVLGNEYNGINGLFSNIISMISLTELGIGMAIVFSLYKPLAENNREQIKAIINLYKNCYRVIAAIVLAIGIGLFFFLDFFIKDFSDSGISINLLRIVFAIFVSDAVFSYLLSYKKCLLIADQKKYITTNIYTISKISVSVLQTLVLLVFKNFIIFSVLMIFGNLANNIFCLIVTNNKYPYIKEKSIQKVDPVEKKGIVKNISALIYHKIGGFVIFSTDNLLVSKFLGLGIAGMYSNYVMITVALRSSIEQILSAVTSGYGNLLALGNKKRTLEVFEVNFFLGFWIHAFVSISLVVIFQPFITVWVGEKSLLPFIFVLILVLYFYVSGMRYPIQVVKDAAGLFDNDKYSAPLEAIVNLVVSILLAKKFGVVGITIGTIASTLAIPFWVKPYIVFKHVFNGGLKKYYLKYLLYFSITVIVGTATYFLAVSPNINNIFLDILYRVVLCVIIPNAVIVALFFKTPQFIELARIFCRHKLFRPVFKVFLKNQKDAL